MYGRAFSRQEDIWKLQAFLAEMRNRVAQAAYFQFGDLVWRMHFPPNRFDEATDMRLWSREDGEILGFVFYLACDYNPEFFLRPELYGSRIAHQMVAWALARAAAGNAKFVETSCIDSDTAKAEFLKREGFVPLGDAEAMVFMERSLDDPIPVYRMPDGYSVVSNLDRPQLAGITGAGLSAEQYARVCAAPGYRDDLGLRVSHQDREIVSGCICWYDDMDRCAEFEPVGTSDAHRRKGLAVAAMAKAMQNLKRYGAGTVYVRTGKNNVPAVMLYQKLGFCVTHVDNGWKRSV